MPQSIAVPHPLPDGLAGIVTRMREGTASRYAIADEGVFALCEHVCSGLRQQLDQLSALLEGGVSG